MGYRVSCLQDKMRRHAQLSACYSHSSAEIRLYTTAGDDVFTAILNSRGQEKFQFANLYRK